MNKDYNTTKDSGKKQKFSTGAHRDTQEGKGRYDLIPPSALKRVAGVYERGSEKYGARNWEKGMPIGRYLDSALRHIYQYIEGRRDEDHLAQAMWNVAGAIHTETMIKRGILSEDLDDMPNHMEAKPDEDEEEPEWGWMKSYIGKEVFTAEGSSRIRGIWFVSGGALAVRVDEGRVIYYSDRAELEAAMSLNFYIGKMVIAEEGAGRIVQISPVDTGIMVDACFKESRQNIYYPSRQALGHSVAQGEGLKDGPVDVDGRSLEECQNTSST